MRSGEIVIGAENTEVAQSIVGADQTEPKPAAIAPPSLDVIPLERMSAGPMVDPVVAAGWAAVGAAGTANRFRPKY